MTLLRCPNPASVEGLRANGTTVVLCAPCTAKNMPADVIATLPLLRDRHDQPECEGEG